jgi:hypothetical protein
MCVFSQCSSRSNSPGSPHESKIVKNVIYKYAIPPGLQALGIMRNPMGPGGNPGLKDGSYLSDSGGGKVIPFFEPNFSAPQRLET